MGSVAGTASQSGTADVAAAMCDCRTPCCYSTRPNFRRIFYSAVSGWCQGDAMEDQGVFCFPDRRLLPARGRRETPLGMPFSACPADARQCPRLVTPVLAG